MGVVNPKIQHMASWWPKTQRDELNVDTVLATDRDRFCQAAAKAGRHVIHIRTESDTKDDMLRHIVDLLQLPESVTNLDALWDVLTDPTFRPHPATVIFCDTSCVQNSDNTALSQILEVFAEARDHTGAPDQPQNLTKKTGLGTHRFDVVATVGRNHT